jgi:hypothetical protein
LPASLARYAGTTGYEPTSPILSKEFERDFFDRISFGKIARYYLTHPARLIHTLDRDAFQALTLRPDLGNFEKSSGAVITQKARANSWWSEGKTAFFPNRITSLAIWIFVFVIGGALVWWRASDTRVRLTAEIFLSLVVLGVIQFVLVSVTQSTIDTAKHMFLFNLSFDTAFVCSFVWVVFVLSRRAKLSLTI